MLKVVRHPPYQGGQVGSPLSRGAGGIPPPIGTPLIKGGRGDPPAYRHPPYQGRQGGSEAKSIFNLIITTYLKNLD
ncbi:MAG: hypothetical protein EWV64_06645 [Microcystis flos-aquae Ma_QC_C_20070823_S18]|uniref:Uncharacterized protein n=1 Tax=Microcystis flos-aquae Mf_QC_C_20070823_S10D TaxID=2486236 RepID=A0A552KTR9_9CHRO|nr:MAG: hypothetical protein EWV64_06645 [Microcystis flos-aquae Ma_QC_C_20070823_S18]TRT97215.1 MAG: hypothetical protein EWV65_12455 [Microcystis flos-aquae Ma_QC_C_20070823_S18D]TRV11331.1 MAG: hypothetical protein EWV45_11525 [Microcystis flos-aquae Mf_QC_C_20070823_S10D]TRV25364.1 MAG: hypothetical protein EWV72_09225 [Microcystis flos-aquae Mf_QC_C_20070823_S10]TRV32869.1 MAG: hypothetical protein EWV70_14545 [Microcystis flos-aquae Mf_QC_C_20070823_S20]TRV38816.1 MAG: hypothetical prote